MSEIDILKKQVVLLKLKTNRLENNLEFYKSVFKTHSNSVIFQLKIKKKNKKSIWVDQIRSDRSFLESLDRDEEIEEWLKPVRCER